MKRSMVDIGKIANGLYAGQVNLVKARNPTWPLSKCHDEVRKSEAGADALELSLRASRAANDPSRPFQKDNSDGAAQQLETGRIQFPGAPNVDHSGANQRSLAGYGVYQDGASELARLRSAQALKKITDHAAVLRQRDPRLSRSAALDKAREEMSAAWDAARR